MAKTKAIKVPKPRKKPMSSLDGYMMVAIDNADLVANFDEWMRHQEAIGMQVVAVNDVMFHNVQVGKLVVLFDKTKDPRWQDK